MHGRHHNDCLAMDAQRYYYLMPVAKQALWTINNSGMQQG